MLLQDKSALVYGGGGSVGGAVARAFAREGARVFLGGRTLATVERVASEITAGGGQAQAAQVDALDEQAVTLAVVASVRHHDTDYDELLMAGVPRAVAREQVRPAVDRVLATWQHP